jgi:hypothetical protein
MDIAQGMCDNEQYNRNGADPDEGLHRNKHVYVCLIERDVECLLDTFDVAHNRGGKQQQY